MHKTRNHHGQQTGGYREINIRGMLSPGNREITQQNITYSATTQRR